MHYEYGQRDPDRTLALIASQLGVDVESLLSDPEFRRAVGADELDRLEDLLNAEDGVSDR